MFRLIYLPISAEYSQTKLFEERLCQVINVTVHCDQRKICDCQKSELEFCATVHLKFHGKVRPSAHFHSDTLVIEVFWILLQALHKFADVDVDNFKKNGNSTRNITVDPLGGGGTEHSVPVTFTCACNVCPWGLFIALSPSCLRFALFS